MAGRRPFRELKTGWSDERRRANEAAKAQRALKVDAEQSERGTDER